MNRKSQTRTQQILMMMRIVVWVAFIGFMVQAGAYLVSFGVSIINPGIMKNLYPGLDIPRLREYDFSFYAIHLFLLIVILIFKASLCYLVIRNLSGITLANPFNMDVARTIQTISYILFASWILSVADYAFTKWLEKKTGEFFGTEVSGELLFMAGLIFIIAQVFKRGVEIQSESELTV